MILWRDLISVTLALLDGVCVGGGLRRLGKGRELWEPSDPSMCDPHIPPPRVLHPPGEEQAAGWPEFYLLLSVWCCAPISPAAPPPFMTGGRGLPSNPSGFLLSATAARLRFSGCLHTPSLTAAPEDGAREAKGREGGKGRAIPLRWAVFPQTKACPPAMCRGSPGCQISGD